MPDASRSGALTATDLADTRQPDGSWVAEDEVGTLDLSLPTTGAVREWLEVAVPRHRPRDTAPAPEATVTMYHHTGARYRAWQLTRAEALDLVALLIQATEQADEPQLNLGATPRTRNPRRRDEHAGPTTNRS